jgi:hypothetical protein
MKSNYSKLLDTWSTNQDGPPVDYKWCDEISPETYNNLMRSEIDTCSASCPWAEFWRPSNWCDPKLFVYTGFPNPDDNMQSCPADIGCGIGEKCRKCTKI